MTRIPPSACDKFQNDLTFASLNTHVNLLDITVSLEREDNISTRMFL